MMVVFDTVWFDNLFPQYTLHQTPVNIQMLSQSANRPVGSTRQDYI